MKSEADIAIEDYEKRFGRKLSYDTSASLRRYDNFTTQIDRFVVDTEKKLLFVLRNAIKDTVDEAQMTIFKGGRMPVKTGFLWSSGVAALNNIPTGLKRGEKTQTYSWSNSFLVKILSTMQIGDVFYFGWTAAYARKQEAQKGFLESAVRNWQTHINNAVGKLR